MPPHRHTPPQGDRAPGNHDPRGIGQHVLDMSLTPHVGLHELDRDPEGKKHQRGQPRAEPRDHH